MLSRWLHKSLLSTPSIIVGFFFTNGFGHIVLPGLCTPTYTLLHPLESENCMKKKLKQLFAAILSKWSKSLLSSICYICPWVEESMMHYHSLLNECPFAQYKLIVENPDLSPGICVRILLRVNKDVLCTVFDIHLQPYTAQRHSPLFLNIIERNPKASLGMNGGTIPSQKIVSDNKKYTLCQCLVKTASQLQFPSNILDK